MTIYEALSTAGLSNLDPQWQGDKQRAGKNLCEWFYGHEKMLSGGKLIRWASFGNMAISDETMVWRSWEQDGQKITKKESTEIENEMLARADQKAKDKKDANETTRQKCAQDFANLSSGNIEIYLRRKSISFPFGGKISLAATPLRSSKEPHLAIPLYDTDHQLWNLQHIYHEGDKTFEKGGKKSGLFYLLETPHHTWFSANPETIYIAEGFATAASIQEALGDAAYCVSAFDAGNLLPVSKALRSAFPHTKIILCADNDAFTKKPGGAPWNPGLENARKAAQACGGAVIFPDFGPQTNTKFTDFNDLHCLRGLQIVKEQIVNAKVETNDVWRGGSLVTIDDKGKRVLPSQHRVATHLLEDSSGRIYKQESHDKEDMDHFAFNGSFWDKVGVAAKDHYRRAVNILCDRELGWSELGEYVDHFLGMTPMVPRDVNLFCPPFDKVAFKNGTLSLLNPAYGNYRLSFTPSFSPLDYITSQLPFDYTENAEPQCPKTDDWLRKAFASDEDVEDKTRLYWQICGSMLIQTHPKIFLFLGDPGTGKSTAIQLAIKLIDRKSLSKLAMTQMKGFDLADMINCRVNYDTDMDTDNAIVDSFVKKICDDDGTRVSRKFRSGADSTLPKVHLFGANKVPKIQDGENNPFDRRMIIVRFNNKTTQGQFSEKYWDYLWQEESLGIIQKAINGLKDLIANKCRYTIPKSSVNEVSEMALNVDPRRQFINEIMSESGWRVKDSVRSIKLDKNSSAKLRDIFAFYKDWMTENSIGIPKSDYSEKRRLAHSLRGARLESRQTNSDTVFHGLSVSDGI